jgi:hypothetical protein
MKMVTKALNSGFFIYPEMRWLGATPDAKVFYPSSSNPHWIMEGKARSGWINQRRGW